MVLLTAVHALLWLAYASLLGGVLSALLRSSRWVRNCCTGAGLLGLTHALGALAVAAAFTWRPELIVGQVDASALPTLRRAMSNAASVTVRSALLGTGVGLAGLTVAWWMHRRLAGSPPRTA